MGNYLGFDTVGPITEEAAKDWWSDSPFSWMGYYLGGCCATAGNDGWTTSISYATLNSIGWGLRALFVGYQQDGNCPRCTTTLTTSNATTLAQDGASNAAKLAAAAGFPANATIFLDVEDNGVLLGSAMQDYVKYWTEDIKNGGQYVPGIYTGPCIAHQLMDLYGDSFTDFWWIADYGTRQWCQVKRIHK